MSRSALKGLLLALAAGGAAYILYSTGSEQVYPVRGRVVGFGDDSRTVIVAHEEVKGFMPAMTMPFRAASPAEVAPLETGDAVGFDLVVTPDSAWIRALHPLPDSAVSIPREPDAPAAARTGPASLARGDAVPEVTLVDQDGRSFALSDFRGRALLVTFIYTRCPIPDFCPLLSRNFQRLQPELARRYGDRAQLLSISFDPAHDTPGRLRAYGERYGRGPHWTLATGSPDVIRRAADAFGARYFEQGTDFDHTLVTALVDSAGRAARFWRGTGWTTNEVLAAVEEVMGRE